MILLLSPHWPELGMWSLALTREFQEIRPFRWRYEWKRFIGSTLGFNPCGGETELDWAEGGVGRQYSHDRGLADPTGSSGVRMALQTHPEQGGQTFIHTPAGHQMQAALGKVAEPWER